MSNQVGFPETIEKIILRGVLLKKAVAGKKSGTLRQADMAEKPTWEAFLLVKRKDVQSGETVLISLFGNCKIEKKTKRRLNRYKRKCI